MNMCKVPTDAISTIVILTAVTITLTLSKAHHTPALGQVLSGL